ncbi:MAG: acetyl-CoA C-acyltransferase [Phycisphaerales bacterium]|nr:acetyl-CoA C-acyltransferase [Phycisphaerales bacterium]
MTQSVILSARRTPVGRMLGGFSRVPATTLGSIAIEAALADAPGSIDRVDECIMGCVLQAALGQNPARQAGLGAGLPVSLSAQTVNKVCGSGLQSVMLADQSIRAGDNSVVVAGGLENMSRAPHMASVRSGIKFGNGELVDHMLADGLTCAFESWPMGCAAEHTAEKCGISRADMDAFAARSHQLATAAAEAGHFEAELVACPADRIKQRADVTSDEGVRGDSTADGLAKLRPAFSKEGSVTAGNASQISDGAAAVVVASAEAASELGCDPLARITASNTWGVEPRDLFEAPGLGIESLLSDSGLSVDDIDLFEINEAFAAQALANVKHLNVPMDRLNICGGGIALGHPIGASGTRVLVTLVHQMRRTGAKRGIVSLCLGGGNAVSMLLEA